jgi:hypothetical protein
MSSDIERDDIDVEQILQDEAAHHEQAAEEKKILHQAPSAQRARRKPNQEPKKRAAARSRVARQPKNEVAAQNDTNRQHDGKENLDAVPPLRRRAPARRTHPYTRSANTTDAAADDADAMRNDPGPRLYSESMPPLRRGGNEFMGSMVNRLICQVKDFAGYCLDVGMGNDNFTYHLVVEDMDLAIELHEAIQYRLGYWIHLLGEEKIRWIAIIAAYARHGINGQNAAQRHRTAGVQIPMPVPPPPPPPANPSAEIAIDLTNDQENQPSSTRRSSSAPAELPSFPSGTHSIKCENQVVTAAQQLVDAPPVIGNAGDIHIPIYHTPL